LPDGSRHGADRLDLILAQIAMALQFSREIAEVAGRFGKVGLLSERAQTGGEGSPGRLDRHQWLLGSRTHRLFIQLTAGVGSTESLRLPHGLLRLFEIPEFRAEEACLE
jgi:hypothetical protein